MLVYPAGIEVYSWSKFDIHIHSLCNHTAKALIRLWNEPSPLIIVISKSCILVHMQFTVCKIELFIFKSRSMVKVIYFDILMFQRCIIIGLYFFSLKQVNNCNCIIQYYCSLRQLMIYTCIKYLLPGLVNFFFTTILIYL